MITERWSTALMFFLVILLAVTLSVTMLKWQSTTFFLKTMRLQNAEVQVIPPGARVACKFRYVTPGDGVAFNPPDAFTINRKYTGALLTVNVEADDWFELFYVGKGGAFDRSQTLGKYNGYASVVWAIEAIHNTYQVEIYNAGVTDLRVSMCRVSVQINR